MLLSAASRLLQPPRVAPTLHLSRDPVLRVVAGQGGRRLLEGHQTQPGRNYSSEGLKSSAYAVIHCAEGFFQTVHHYTHLPWWGVIVLSTVTLRSLVTLPLAVHQNKLLAKTELLLPTLREYQEAVKHNVVVKSRRAGLSVEEANKRIRKEVLRASLICTPPTTICCFPFHRLVRWLMTFTLRRVVTLTRWPSYHGFSCHSGLPYLSPSETCLGFSRASRPLRASQRAWQGRGCSGLQTSPSRTLIISYHWSWQEQTSLILRSVQWLSQRPPLISITPTNAGARHQAQVPQPRSADNDKCFQSPLFCNGLCWNTDACCEPVTRVFWCDCYRPFSFLHRP